MANTLKNLKYFYLNLWLKGLAWRGGRYLRAARVMRSFILKLCPSLSQWILSGTESANCLNPCVFNPLWAARQETSIPEASNNLSAQPFLSIDSSEREAPKRHGTSKPWGKLLIWRRSGRRGRFLPIFLARRPGRYNHHSDRRYRAYKNLKIVRNRSDA